MICFMDRAFCSSDCTQAECPKHFGEDDKLAAKEWARRCGFDEGEVPVSWSDFSDGCPEYTKPEKP